MDETDCMVNIAKYFLEFTQAESCGKCVPCRIGTKRLLEILQRITDGRGRPGDTGLLEKLSNDIKSASLCGLGQTASGISVMSIRPTSMRSAVLQVYARTFSRIPYLKSSARAAPCVQGYVLQELLWERRNSPTRSSRRYA